MKSVLSHSHISLGALSRGVLLLSLTVLAAAEDWPAGHVVEEKSVSPDGRYALVIPAHATLQDDHPDTTNYLADVKAHRVLGKIRGADYIQNENHHDAAVFWAADSSRVLVNYDARFGFDKIVVLEPHQRDFTQVEIGKSVHASLDALIAKQPRSKELSCSGAAYYRWLPSGKVELYVLGLTNPKSSEWVTSYFALFQGTYDPGKQKWAGVSTRMVNDRFEEIQAMLGDSDFFNHTFDSEDDRAVALDKVLNDVYGALHFVLPADHFAQVKKDQIAWLKTRDAAASAKAKCELLEARIKALQELAW